MTTPLTPQQQALAAQQRRERVLQLRNRITPDQAKNIGALFRENPSLPPGVIYAAGSGGIQPGTPASKALSDADLKKKQEKGEFSFGALVGRGYRGLKKGLDAVTPDVAEEFIKDDVYSGVKGFSRGAFATFSAPGETIQGAFRDAAADGSVNLEDVARLPQRLAENVDNTTIGEVFGQVKRRGFGGVDTGNGFFVGGEARDSQRENAINQAPMEINGRRVGTTFGRYYARKLDLEPGGTAYNLVSGLADATIALTTDPTSYVTPVVKGVKAAKSFSGDASKGFADKLPEIAGKLQVDMGALQGIRRTVDSDRVLEFLTTDRRGVGLVDYLAGETDILRLYEVTKGKLDPDLMLELSRSTLKRDEVIRILGPRLGRDVGTEQKFGLDAVGRLQAAQTGGAPAGLGTIATAKFKGAVDKRRMFGTLPGEVLPVDDIGTSIRFMDNALKNAKVSRADRAEVMAKMAAATDRPTMLPVAELGMRKIAESAEAGGLAPQAARDLTLMFSKSMSDRMAYFQNQIGKNDAFGRPEDLKYLENGELRAVPHLAAQFLNGNIPLPDARAIRRATSKYRNILNNPAIDVPLSAVESITQNLFKPLVLLRPAYIIRNQLDVQFRAAGVALASAFNHPTQYMGWLLNDLEGIGKALGKVGIQTGRGAVDDAGVAFNPVPELKTALKEAKRSGDAAAIKTAQDNLDRVRNGANDELAASASRYLTTTSGGIGNWERKSRVELDGMRLAQKGESDYSRIAAENLDLAYRDPVARRVANGKPFDGDVGATTDDLDGIKEWWWSGGGKEERLRRAGFDQRMSWLNDRAGADEYIDKTVTWVDNAVGQSRDLRDAAITGGINRVPLMLNGETKVNPQAIALLDEMRADPSFLGPDAIAGKLVTSGADDTSYMDRALDFLWKWAADKPDNFLGRSPVYRQRYYQRMESLIGFMTPQAQQQLIAGARNAKMKSSYMKRLQDGSRNSGKVTIEEARLVAGHDAANFTKELFYDLSERGQFFDVTRLLFPFGEAFKDSAMKYSELVAQNPVLPYRLGQVIDGGRKADADGDGEGFFHTDEVTGEEVFSWQGSGALMDFVGLDAAQGGFNSPLKNLNILGTTVVPGFGPVVQIAASQLLPDVEDFDGIREMINPYGERTLEGGALESFLPAWFSKFRTAELIPFLDASPDQARKFVEAQKDVMAYLVSTGEYDQTDPAEKERLLDDAKSQARGIFFIRGMAQAVLPAPPSPEFVAKDKDGVILTQFKLAEEFRKIQDEQREAGTPEQTNRLFIEKFGPDAVLAAIPNTKPGEDRSPVTPSAEGADFLRKNRAASVRFPTVFGLFGPERDFDGEVDFATYDRNLRTKDTVPITPEEAMQRSNQFVARMIEQQAKDLAGPDPSPEAKKALKELKSRLSEEYPGYSASFNNNTPALIEDLKRAAKDKQLSKTPPGKALNIWLEARDLAEQGAQQKFGTGWARSDKARGIRDAMRALADQLSDEYPGFEQMFERALEREMVKDDVIPTTPGASQ